MILDTSDVSERLLVVQNNWSLEGVAGLPADGKLGKYNHHPPSQHDSQEDL